MQQLMYTSQKNGLFLFCGLFSCLIFIYIFFISQGVFAFRESFKLRRLGQKAPEAVSGSQAKLAEL